MSDLRDVLTFLSSPRYRQRSLTDVTGDPRLSGACYEIVLDPPSRPLVFEGVVALEFEDGRQAAIAEVGGDEAGEDGPFIRLHSWDETKQHRALMPFNGRRVRVTVEVV